MKGLISYDKELGCYPVDPGGEALKIYKHRSDMINLEFF